MNHSNQINELAAALCAAQGEFEAVAKDATNPFFKSKYADLPAIVKSAAPILVKHGLAVTQLLGHDGSGDTLTTVLLHSSGQFISDTMQLRPVKDDPQAQGSATSYGRRYSYMAVLGLVADEDDDGNAASVGSRKPARKPSKQIYTPAPATAVSTSGGTPPSDKRGETITKIRAAFEQSGKSADWLSLKLIEITGRDSSPATLRADIPALSSDEALLLLAALSFDGSQLDDGTPGSGETAA